MSNVIDALKRLERIGSEHSETTRKIIEAAHELSKKIGGLYPESSGAEVAFGFDESYLDRGGQSYYRLRRDENAPVVREIGERGPLRVYNWGLQKFVHEDREAALRFASDIAAGLLDCIEQDLQKRLAEDKERLPSLESAVKALGKE